ncbi:MULTISPECIES: hypothetical protein [unclassified Pseudoalteromonas]|uniref:P-loop NTPase n=1 Tax=unclassified Pseudoalteromonas TaxID=194690 RepID=UPI0020977D38|nr:hypothetical protein [Pseudoalteromonas sp. XMcav2-N]MCO7187395.1 hypothetical protein [Pseudoalteromonas sp. XMcav2-N]
MEIEDNYKALHALIQEQCAAKEFHLKKKLSGKSGDSVYLCDIIIDNPSYSGFAVIKYSTNHPQYSKDEFAAHQLAAKTLPEFAEQHIPKLIKKVDGDNQSAFIMTIAGNGLSLTEELASLTHDIQSQIMCHISELLLEKWHTGSIAAECSAQTVLSNWLDYRIGEQSTLPKLLADLLDISAQEASFYFAGKSFTNPFFHAKTPGLPLGDIKLRPLEGYMHGDLHGHNCLYGGQDRGKQSAFLIDFEQFKEGVPLFFDHAYLEFSLLLNNHTELSIQEWTSVIDLLTDIEEKKISDTIDIDGEIYNRVRQIQRYRKSIRDWVTKHYSARFEDVYTQILLARVAAGLNFANKGRLADDDEQSNKMKVFAFLYAATNLNHLYKTKKVAIDEPQVIAQPVFATPIENNEVIEPLWKECDYFHRHKAKYLLIAGSKLNNLSAEHAELLTALPWNLVLDFDTERNGLLGKSEQYIKNNKPWKRYFPEQIDNTLETDILVWLSINGHELDVSSIYNGFKAWRRTVPNKLRVLSEELAKHTSVLPVNLVVIADKTESNKTDKIIEALDEYLGDKLKVVVLCDDDDEQQAYEELGSNLELDEFQCIQCPSQDFVKSISQYYTLPSQSDKVLIPSLSSHNNEFSKVEVPKELYALSSKCLTILHPGLVQDKTGIGQFRKGHKISWAELEQDLAIEMPQDSKIIKQASGALKKNSYEKFTIYHPPGSGGSTAIRKAAWRLKDDWPAVEVIKNSVNIHEYIEKIYNLTNLPVLVVVDGSVLNSTEKEKLVNELKVRGVIHLLLESERGSITPAKKHKAALAVPCPLELKDARLFCNYYTAISDPSRHVSLENLTNDENMAAYRQPFFYGFYAFEDEYGNIESFIENSTKDLPDDKKRLLLWVALISRYTQESLPKSFLNVMQGKEASSAFRIKNVFGSSAEPLFKEKNNSVSIIHPIIAQQLLFKLLGKHEPIAYPERLRDACIALIDSLSTNKLCNEDKTGQILQGLFIFRQSGGNQDSGNKAKFSELLQEIKSPNKQHNVLKHLCEKFSDEPHYYSHFGRHINYDNSRDSNEAIRYFERAIELDSENEVHYHGLAMVYSNLVIATLDDISRNPESQQGHRIRAIEVIERIEKNYEQSKSFFKKAYEFTWKSEHALVSYTKLIERTVDAIYRQSKPADTAHGEYKYCDFFKQNNQAAKWCREALEELEWAISELKQLQAEGEMSHHAEERISRVPKYYDDKASLIEGLSSLIASHADIDHSNTRRLLASTYFKIHEESGLTTQKLSKVVELMENNIAGNNGDDRDIKYWFRAYRMLPNFSYPEAIDKIEAWEQLKSSLQASYYLYILHYFFYQQGVGPSQQKAKDYIEKCNRNLSISTTSKKSFEWESSDNTRVLPLVNSNELGKWDGFFEHTKKLRRVTGMILSVESHVKGTIRINGFEAFFVPKSEFTTDDVNTEVSFYLGFSFEGLRAWKVEKQKRS